MMIGCVKLFNGKQSKGDYTEISYYDDADREVAPEEASRVRIREILANGEVVKESWGFCGVVRKPA
ncbi:MAG: hypothetical protein K5739_04810 [Lachnospiraceae bacterium]|nr:hypothetical protein [Lachnospiraceae bacterium]